MITVGLMYFTATYAQQPSHRTKDSKKSKKNEWVSNAGIKQTTKNVYFPEQNVYYNVDKKTYIYKSEDKWKESKKVPNTMKSVDLNKANKVEIDDKSNTPQSHNDSHKKKYSGKQSQAPQTERRR